MYRITITILVVLTTINAQGEYPFFIGHGSSMDRTYFAIVDQEWDWGMNYCNVNRLMPGSIGSETDIQTIVNFLNTSTLIGDRDRVLWLAATDHKEEGVFQWLLDSREVDFGTWVPGMPSINRTANCLAINSEGQFFQEKCFDSGHLYLTLCQAPRFNYGPDLLPQRSRKLDVNSYVENTLPPVPLSLTIIGQVGDRMYLVDNETLSWTASLDHCHSAGMRLATPENPDELQFIQEYAIQQTEIGERAPIYHLGGTDRLAVSCLKTNTEFRWFYSGNSVTNQEGLIGDSHWYMCTHMGAEGLRVAGCAHGGGAYAHPICEITV